MTDKVQQTLIFNISELVTCAPLAATNKLSFIEDQDLGRIQDAWLLIENEKVADFGTGSPPQTLLKAAGAKIDAQKKLITPGLIDSHTHPVFKENRFLDFSRRLKGTSYAELSRLGGGILHTVSTTQKASNQTLYQRINTRLAKQLTYGVTSVEVKSGYGFTVAEELRHLEILNKTQQSCQQTLKITCLGLHSPPLDGSSKKKYIQTMSQELIPEVARSKLADSVDAFVEKGYFEADEIDSYVTTAQDLGLGIRVHADEFSDSGAATAAARWKAQSADHLQQASLIGLRQMADAGVVATILPGTSLYCNIAFANAKAMAETGCPVAIASDFNPGSCYIDNLTLIAATAGIHCHLNLAQIFAAVTYVPAYSLRLHQSKGALAKGYDADLLLHDIESLEEWIADMGRTPPKEVWVKGKCVVKSANHSISGCQEHG